MKHIILAILPAIVFAVLVTKVDPVTPIPSHSAPTYYLSYHATGTQTRKLVAASGGIGLPDSLVIPPGVYEGHDCTEEGIVRFVGVDQTMKQRIVWKDDIDRLMSSIAWLGHHGTADSSLSATQMATEATTRNLSIACGDICRLAVHIGGLTGVNIRTVHVETLEPFDGINDGHYINEVFIGGAWIAYDLDANCGFRINGKPAGVDELIGNTFDIFRISGDTQLDTTWQYLPTAEYFYSNRREMYARVFQIRR